MRLPKIRKEALNNLSTAFGTIAGIATVLTTSGIIDRELGGAIAGVSTVLLGVVTQQPSKEFTEVEKVVKNDHPELNLIK